MPFFAVPVSPLYRLPAFSMLRFAGNTTDAIDHGSASTLDDISPVTSLFWLRMPTASNGGSALIISEKTESSYTTCVREFFVNDVNDYFQIEFQLNGVSNALARSTETLSVSTWYFIGYSWDGSNAPKLYRGSQTSEVSETGYAIQQAGVGVYITDAGENYKVGKHPIGTEKGWLGDIAWHGLWNRVLTLEEIRGQQANPTASANCVLFCNYGVDGTGSQTDQSGNANHGTVTGAVVGTAPPFPRQAAYARRGRR